MKKVTIEEFIDKCNDIHGSKYRYDNTIYFNMRKNVEITCPIHGNFLMRPDHYLEGRNCPICSSELLSAKKSKTLEQFLIDARKIHGDRYSYVKFNYKNNFVKSVIICHLHGEFLQRPNSHLNGSGCPTCGHAVSGDSRRHDLKLFKKTCYRHS